MTEASFETNTKGLLRPGLENFFERKKAGNFAARRKKRELWLKSEKEKSGVPVKCNYLPLKYPTSRVKFVLV